MNPEILEQNQGDNESDVLHTPVENAYPKVRHVLLVLCVLFTLCVLILLLYQNGKSIYDNGI